MKAGKDHLNPILYQSTLPMLVTQAEGYMEAPKAAPELFKYKVTDDEEEKPPQGVIPAKLREYIRWMCAFSSPENAETMALFKVALGKYFYPAKITGINAANETYSVTYKADGLANEQDKKYPSEVRLRKGREGKPQVGDDCEATYKSVYDSP